MIEDIARVVAVLATFGSVALLGLWLSKFLGEAGIIRLPETGTHVIPLDPDRDQDPPSAALVVTGQGNELEPLDV